MNLVRGAGDWMAEHFFTAHHALRRPARALHKDLCIYAAMGRQILQLFAAVYGKGEAIKWLVRWRVFYIACELFGYNGGNEWVVAHYLFAKRTDLK